MLVFSAAVILVFVSLSSTLTVLKWPPLNCSRQVTGNCMDRRWLDVNKYTPSSPEELQVSVDIRQDEMGHLQPVLDAIWKLKDDGSIRFLNATELHVLVMSTNQNLCVRYSFKDKLPMRSPSGQKWSFSANMVVLEPGHRYRVSVFNIPKPELGHSSYDVSTDVIVPDCKDHKMQMTQFCIERGSMWSSNISLTQVTAVSGISTLAVSFSPDRLCEEYIVIVTCSTTQYTDRAYKANQTTLIVTFSLDKWPRSCCQFDVEIKPIFQQCGPDCTRRRTTLDICPEPPSPPDVSLYTFLPLVVVLICVVTTVIMFLSCRKSGKNGPKPEYIPSVPPPEQPPKVLVIYSQDHYLYRDIVLKLCAFLQAKCGIKVLVDFLDTTSVDMWGRLRWLEWQCQQLKNPSDKILVLCSRGVQAKWRAMCGQCRVTLREDLLSPTDDMLTPFLNIFLPAMHQAGMLGKYVVAYFDDISSEQDVPSVFDIAVKYKLMKHFEELYFRIVNIEKYQPGQVNHIEGISGDEYFNCPSGRALKNAIETFQAYQLENPDWFEKECVHSEDEVVTQPNLYTDQLQIPPVLECVPLIRDGLTAYTHEVEIAENYNSVHVITPELNPEHQLSSVVEITPVANPECKYPYLSNLEIDTPNHLYLHSPSPASVFVAEPILYKLSTPRQNLLSHKNEPSGQIPTEDEEEDSLLPMSHLSANLDLGRPALQNPLYSGPPESSCAGIQSEYFSQPKISHFQPVEMEEIEVLEPSGKGSNSGSDQGYISKMSSQHESPLKEDPLVALARLQEELLLQNLRYSHIGPEGN
uniref:Interleukin 17 receptor A1a n=1 Tax=Mastacembelus armatus TaxID=205130 RepID=A0A7N8XJQ2_9TELE